MSRPRVFYATTSKFKRQEFNEILLFGTYRDGAARPKIRDAFDFQFSDIRTEEPLEIDLIEMVKHKARSAYKQLLMPCIVEHAGLILERQFPGGLTQPMWDELGADGFLKRTGAKGEPAIARAVIGFCDGMKIETSVGETKGTIALAPRGNRD